MFEIDMKFFGPRLRGRVGGSEEELLSGGRDDHQDRARRPKRRIYKCTF